MAAILRRIRKSSLSSSIPKHEKLLDESDLGEKDDPVLAGVNFKVKYLGCCPVTADSGEEITANAIKAILAAAKRLESKLRRVEVTVSLAGVTVREQEALQCLLDLPIDSISYCSADPTYDHVFALLCTGPDGTATTCHAFLTHKRKMAQAATLTIAQAFNLAYEVWRSERPRARPSERCPVTPPNSVVVTRAEVEPPSSLASAFACNLLGDLQAVALCGEKAWLVEEQATEGDRWNSESSASWVQFGEEEEAAVGPFDMHDRAELPLLSGLASGSGWESPLGSTPIQGSRLTPSCLSSPVGSPALASPPQPGPLHRPPSPPPLRCPPSPPLLDWGLAPASPVRGYSSSPAPVIGVIPHISWPGQGQGL